MYVNQVIILYLMNVEHVTIIPSFFINKFIILVNWPQMHPATSSSHVFTEINKNMDH